MWLKLLLLTLYLFLLFVLSRLLEVASWYHDSTAIFSSFSSLDPITLSVKKLKQLLDNRGISYSGVVEKTELMDLVKSSGEPVNEELTDDEDETSPATTLKQPMHFTGGSHFYENVEDTKDSAWLVHVIVDDDDPLLITENTWNDVISKVSKFGVRTGIFRCSLDKRLCSRKGWMSPRLILALPRGNKAKEDVVLHSYMQRSTSLPILQWVRDHLASRVKAVASIEELKEQWITYTEKSKKSEIRIVFFSVLKICPMFLSSLAIRFTGRAKFGMVHTTGINATYKNFLMHTSNLPVYLIITKEKTFYYGFRKGECFNYQCMELFLKSFVPEMNDVFLWSFLLVNVIASFELFLSCSQMLKHFLRFAMHIVKYNCGLFLVWLLILALYQFPFMVTCQEALLKCLRIFSGTYVASVLRNDWKSFSLPVLLTTFILYSCIVSYILRKIGLVRDDISTLSSWWLVPWETLTRPMSSQDMDLELGMELLIERLATPNLWLQPVISMEYINNLPVWKYQGWCDADDSLDENKSDNVCSSDDESANPSLVTETLVPNSWISTVDNQCSNVESTGDISSQANVSEDLCVKDSKTIDSPLVHSPNLYQQAVSRKHNSQVPDVSRAPTGMLEFRECSICLESYHYGENLCGLPCGHNFHLDCIMPWFFRDNHCCPVCRWPSYKHKNRVPHLHNQ